MDELSQTSIPELLLRAFEDNLNGLVLIDNDQSIFQANRKFIEFTGLNQDDVKNTILTQFF
jgi:PAS domain S-box-containing protein